MSGHRWQLDEDEGPDHPFLRRLLVPGMMLGVAVTAWALTEASDPNTEDMLPSTTTTVVELAPPMSWVQPTWPEDRNEDRSDRTTVEVFEDGSGIQWIDGIRVRTFPEDTFVWDCRTMGNRTCGPVAS